MSKLWMKKDSDQLDEAIERFEVGEDYLLDMKLVVYDIYGSLAHGKMLTSIGIMSDEEYSKIKKEMIAILEDYHKGNFIITIQDEDVHTKVENRLTEKLGDIGKKIHTARSRNDQVLVDTRLYTKNQLLVFQEQVLNLTQILYNFANQYEMIPMPGYTHMQIAMPSSIGMWGGSFIESLLDELIIIKGVYELNDQSPLGSGAGYGVSVPIDRELTQQLLGFNRLQVNSLYCGNSRGKIESQVISSVVGVGLVLNKMATDLLLFTTKEFDFFKVSDQITTGSSIMPQKKNLDVLELIRAKVSSLLGLDFSIKSLLSNLPSGYNRDFQDTKKFLMSAFDIISPMIELMQITIGNLVPKEDHLIKAHKKEIYATNEAYRLVMEEKMPFRDAYRQVGTHLDELDNLDPYEVIKSNTALGATGNLKLYSLKNTIQKELNDVKTKIDQFENHLMKLTN